MSVQAVRWSEDLETALPDEESVVEETVRLMRSTLEKSFEEHRHGTSATHAKSHGVVTGTVTVPDDLPPELAQGMFASPATYEAVVRYASEPGQIDPDTARRARGLALKVLDVPGEKLEPGWTSQDWLFNTWPVIPQGDAATYLDAIRARERHAGHHLRSVAATAVKHPAPKGLLFDRTPNLHPLAFTYYTQGAFRLGDHVAKLGVFPVAAEQLALADREVSAGDPPGVLARWVHDYFAGTAARYELRAQLLTDVDRMPVEDASVEWPEELSPYRTVAVLDLPPQESFSPARRVHAEDVMAWRPWSGLVEHRPLGSINRVRRRAYAELGAWRHEVNARAEADPRTLDEVPV